MGDQFPNAQRVKYRNIGVALSPQDLTEDVLYEAIRKVTTDPSIGKNAMKLGSMLRMEREHGIASESSWWIEWRLRHDQKVLDKYVFPKGSKLSYVEYFYLDLISAIFVIFALTLYKLL